MNTCRECIEFLDEYLAGELPEAQRATFEIHLKKCPPCERYLKSYEDAIRIARECMCQKSACDDMPDELVAAILAARKKGGE